MRFLDLFNEIEKGNYGLTDEAVYSSIQTGDIMIPLYGGNSEHQTTDRGVSMSAKTKTGMLITVFSQEGIIISLDGSAGCMTYKNNEKFALNHHAGFITQKVSGNVNMKYFSIFFQNFYKNIAVSNGSKTLSLQQIYSEEFDIPCIEVQDRIVNQIVTLQSQISILMNMKERISSLKAKSLCLGDNVIYLERRAPLSKIVHINQGHQITDEEIYLSQGNVPIYTGANEIKGYWNKSIIGKSSLPCLSYATKAFDGTITMQDCLFDANNTAVVFLKSDYKDIVMLEWLKYILPNILLDKATSKEGVSYLNKEIVNNIEIDIPSIDIQKRIIDTNLKIIKWIAKIDKILIKYNKLLLKEITIANFSALTQSPKVSN